MPTLPIPKISVIIPSWNNQLQLISNLIEWNNQTIPSDQYEVIVIDDGSTPPVLDVYNDISKSKDIDISYILRFGKSNKSKGSGAGFARNTGAMAARGEYLLFVGDDCVPTSNLLSEIISEFETYPNIAAVQGLTVFHPRVYNDFIQWLDQTGMQANWASLKDEQGNWRKDASRFCLTTNYAIRRDIFDQFKFDNEFFKNAAWEDVSFGYRLAQVGFGTSFKPTAVNFHEHHYTMDTFYNRQHMVGRNMIYLFIRHPEMVSMIDTNEFKWAKSVNKEELKHLANSAFALPLAIDEKPSLQHKYGGAYLRYAMLSGFLDELKNVPEVSPLRFLLTAHSYKEQIMALAAMYGYRTENYGWFQHNLEWLRDISDHREDVITFVNEMEILWEGRDTEKTWEH